MRAPRFWHAPPPAFAARMLAPLGAAYGALAAARMARPGTHVGAPVITIGNFVAGGAGKTPTAIAVARLLIARGEKPAFVSRGYGGRVAQGRRVVQATDQPADEIGDEPPLLSAVAPTFVGADRAAVAARAIAEASPSVVILDDGLQSRAVEPDIAIAVVDGATGVGNGLCIPAGPLRAPLAAQMARVSAIVVIGDGAPGDAAAQAARSAGAAVLRARMEPDPRARALAGRKVVAFAGIGLPEKFFATVESLGAVIVARRAYPDHYAYRPADAAELSALARRFDARLVTTQKDFVRLPPLTPAPLPIPVNLRFEDEDAIERLLARGLAGARP